MATILPVIIYVAFTGLGIPESLFGTAWHAICGLLGQAFSMGGSPFYLAFLFAIMVYGILPIQNAMKRAGKSIQ